MSATLAGKLVQRASKTGEPSSGLCIENAVIELEPPPNCLELYDHSVDAGGSRSGNSVSDVQRLVDSR